MAEASRRPQIAHGSVKTITVPFEQGGETVHVRSTWPPPQVPKHPWRGKIYLQHFVSPLVTGQRMVQLEEGVRTGITEIM